MIDLTNLKAPGWQRVVADLSAGAPDDKTFFDRLMQVMAQVSAARRATLWLPTRTDGEEIEPVAGATWPVEGGAGVEGLPASEYEPAAKSAARAAFSSGAARAFGLDKETPYYDGAPGQGYILAVPLPGAPVGARADGSVSSAPSPAVITLLIEPRSRDAIRSTLAMAEVLAGYVNLHGSRQQLRRTQAASFAFDLATRLVASINAAPSFKGAVLQLTNDLSKQFGVDRVALGWVRTDAVRVEAISDTEHFDRRMAMVQRLQSAMDECLDQEQPVLFPQPAADGPGSDVLLSQAIVHAHRELAAGDARLKVCSLPLRVDESVVGVVTIESTGAGNIDLATIELIQASMDLVSPVLRIRKSDDRALPLRAYDSGVRAGGWIVGPKHTVWKVLSVLVFAAAIFVTFYKTTYRVSAEAVLQPRNRRVVSAPFDGVIRTLADNLEPGKVVKAGDLLVQLDTTELELSRNDAQAKIIQAATQEAAALHDKDSGAAEKARAQIAQAQAQVDYINYRIERSAIISPIDGMVIGGDLKSRLGGTIKLGDPMLEVAQMGDIIAVAQVDDRDIWLLKRAFEEKGGTDTGAVVTKSQPGEPYSLTVERIVPLASAKEGKNTFEVRARIDGPAPWMVPGTEGIAKFDTRRASLLWIGTRRVVDAVRLWLW